MLNFFIYNFYKNFYLQKFQIDKKSKKIIIFKKNIIKSFVQQYRFYNFFDSLFVVECNFFECFICFCLYFKFFFLIILNSNII